MDRRKVLAFGVGGLGLLLAVFSFFSEPSREEIVAARVKDFLEVFSHSESTGNPVFYGGALNGQLKELMVEQPRVKVDGTGLSGTIERRALAMTAARSLGFYQNVDFSVSGLRVSLEPVVEATGTVTLTAVSSAELRRESRDVRFVFDSDTLLIREIEAWEPED